VLVQTFGIAKRLFDVPPSAFAPPPKVDSTVFSVRPRPEPLVDDADDFLRFVSACFHQKRKTLRNNLLGTVDPSILATLPEAGQRAEQLTIEQFVDLYRRVSAATSILKG
jgi:16S rRNA (adenine1518-N6/adenine1519-N6)-dimethyltransferase